MKKAYVLNHKHGLLSKNETSITVSNGLLSKGKSTFTSGANDAAKNLGTLAGLISANEFSLIPGETKTVPAEKTPPCAIGKNRVAIKVEDQTPTPFCNVSIIVKPLAISFMSGDAKVSSFEDGLYYRINLPYLVTATTTQTDNVLNKSELIYSPSESPALFLPLAKGFFSNNNADFEFNDGVITQYQQTTEGELIAALKLPADVLSAYFAAIGSIFDAFKKNDVSETDRTKAQIQLELIKKKYDACVDALNKNDSSALQTLKCDG